MSFVLAMTVKYILSMPKQNIVIITGGSKGIGKGLAKQYAKNNFIVYSLSRTTNSELSKFNFIKQIKVDLTNTQKLNTAFDIIFSELIPQEIKKITLINNAGTLGTISNLDNVDIENIAKSIKLNLSVPLQLSSLFIKATQNWDSLKKIINISSGAASSFYEGWSVYCSSKSAIDMFTKVVAKEQENLENGVKILSIKPGIVATNMQEQIRNTSKKDFKIVDRFIALHESGSLSNTTDVAKKIYTIDIENRLENGELFDVRNFNS